jgi:hypothetical protein
LTYSNFTSSFEVPSNTAYVKVLKETSVFDNYFLISTESGTGTTYEPYYKKYKIDESIDLFNEEITKELQESYFSTLSVFERFGVIGDSYASGYVASPKGYGGEHLSWGKILARMCGNTCTNFSKGGLSTRT